MFYRLAALGGRQTRMSLDISRLIRFGFLRFKTSPLFFYYGYLSYHFHASSLFGISSPIFHSFKVGGDTLLDSVRELSRRRSREHAGDTHAEASAARETQWTDNRVESSRSQRFFYRGHGLRHVLASRDIWSRRRRGLVDGFCRGSRLLCECKAFCVIGDTWCMYFRLGGHFLAWRWDNEDFTT